MSRCVCFFILCIFPITGHTESVFDKITNAFSKTPAAKKAGSEVGDYAKRNLPVDPGIGLAILKFVNSKDISYKDDFFEIKINPKRVQFVYSTDF